MIKGTAILTAFVVLGLGILAGGSEAVLTGPRAVFVAPVAGASVSQQFGCTSYAFEPVNPHCPSLHWHSGIDLAAASGRPVVATLSGAATVILDTFGYGLHVILDHGQGLSSLYGHLQRVDVRNGEWVVAGQRIGALGSTGNSSGPHLHFEIRRDGVAENPQLDLPLP